MEFVSILVAFELAAECLETSPIDQFDQAIAYSRPRPTVGLVGSLHTTSVHSNI